MKAYQLTNSLYAIAKVSFAIAILCLLTNPARSQVYKYVDENGNVIYSDTPPEEQKDLPPARLPDLIIQPAVQIPAPKTTNATSEDLAEISVDIIEPTDETTIPPGQASFAVAAKASRPLAAEEVAILLVNGQEFARSSTTLSWSINNLIRGEMILQVQIRNPEGELLAASTAIRVFVRRPTVPR